MPRKRGGMGGLLLDGWNSRGWGSTREPTGPLLCPNHPPARDPPGRGATVRPRTASIRESRTAEGSGGAPPARDGVSRGHRSRPIPSLQDHEGLPIRSSFVLFTAVAGSGRRPSQPQRSRARESKGAVHPRRQGFRGIVWLPSCLWNGESPSTSHTMNDRFATAWSRVWLPLCPALHSSSVAGGAPCSSQ